MQSVDTYLIYIDITVVSKCNNSSHIAEDVCNIKSLLS